jgi:hypothetical protein
MELPQGWIAVASEQQAESLQSELQKELSPSHPLYGSECRAVARCGTNDDVLFQTNSEDFQYAMVHLTWRGRVEVEGWPETKLFTSYQEFHDFILNEES